jgi:hypothetical protein
LNLLIEFLSDYFSEKTIDFRNKWAKGFALLVANLVNLSSVLTKSEIFAIVASTSLLSFVLTWSWTPDFSYFWETFIIFFIIIVIIFFIKEGLRALLCTRLSFKSKYYIWPIGSIMMIVSTALGNTFSLAANHHYEEEDIKKCGKVSYIVSFVLYILVLTMFFINLTYPSTILQMIIIVIILNLFIDMFPLKPMDGYEVRKWNIFLWLGLYIVVFITYVVVYFNIFP